MTADGGPNKQTMTTWPARKALALFAIVALSACGHAPLESIGLRSSGWLNEPTVPTTIVVDTTTPSFFPVSTVQWANDGIDNQNLDDVEAMLLEIFERREGDRYVQASRAEITTAIPDVAFPDIVPTGAQWVSSQLVFETDGRLSTDPMVAFGIWSAEPYTRSRSVAQMVVLRVFDDPERAEELATGAAEPNCTQLADRASDSCELISEGARVMWLLDESNGTTVIWYDGTHRYEMYGRTFVSGQILRQMTASMVPLTSISAE